MRKMKASRRYREASQKTRERVAEFVTYLDGLEEDMEELPEHVGKDALLMGLLPKIKVKIMETLPPPTTQQQVSDLAIQIQEARNQATRAIGGVRPAGL
ncbi:MAG: lysophospholipid acyltransferase, partial [Watsoniomyces obsoletus]